MTRRYSAGVSRGQSLPALWLISDERNDAALDDALARLPRGSGFVYRHYHLPDAERVARYAGLERLARARDHLVILADSALTAREWGADRLRWPWWAAIDALS
jgi:thiamine-phosphate pyrophosphorylase